MEYRQLGASGIKIPVLSYGTATFGGGNEFFKAWGETQLEEAKTLINICLEEGVNLFDTANVYSKGLAEEILGKALGGLRNQVLISTKATFPMGDGPNEYGSSRFHLMQACEDSLRRLNTDRIDIYHMHGFDGNTPVEETLRALDDLVTSGKVRYIACSNFSGWHLMKSLSVSEKQGFARYVGHQAYYSLLNREFEWELMPLGLDQNVGTIVWSPLSAGLLSGKFKRNQPKPENSRLSQGGSQGPETNFELLYNIIDVLEEVAVLQPLDAMRVRHGTHADDELVVGYVESLLLAPAVELGYFNQPTRKVNVLSACLHKVASNPVYDAPNRFHQ